MRGKSECRGSGREGEGRWECGRLVESVNTRHDGAPEEGLIDEACAEVGLPDGVDLVVGVGLQEHVADLLAHFGGRREEGFGEVELRTALLRAGGEGSLGRVW